MAIKVMWPRLVANKILRKRWDSNNFVADYPNSGEGEDLSPEIQSSDQEPLSPNSIFNDLKKTKKYKVYVSTWNVGGIEPPDNLDMDDWLDRRNNPCDVYVLGFQEIVPLSAGNVLGAEKNRISMKWNSLVRAALHKNTSMPDNTEETITYPMESCKSLNSNIPMDFQCIISKNMVGIMICVWIKSELRPFVQHPSVSCVGCGIMGCLGNKGSVSVRFCLHETSFCFVCGHLASGGKEGDEKHRNSDATEILTRTSFPRGPLNDLPPKILDHDRVVFLGDLNYRISLSEATTRSLVENKEWNTLFEKDQLRVELMKSRVFEGWQEGAINFSPTYKYYPNSDIYYGCDQSKKGEKRRAPAWCDRIIWFGKGLKQKEYRRGESKLSDHRPVWAIFTAEVEMSNAKELKKYFSSSGYGRSANHFDIFSSSDEFRCNGRASFR